MFGWPCDAEMEKLRDDFARETDPAKQKDIAEAVQVRDTEFDDALHLGAMVSAGRDAQERHRHLTAPAPVFWNVEKKGLLTSLPEGEVEDGGAVRVRGYAPSAEGALCPRRALPSPSRASRRDSASPSGRGVRDGHPSMKK